MRRGHKYKNILKCQLGLGLIEVLIALAVISLISYSVATYLAALRSYPIVDRKTQEALVVGYLVADHLRELGYEEVEHICNKVSGFSSKRNTLDRCSNKKGIFKPKGGFPVQKIGVRLDEAAERKKNAKICIDISRCEYLADHRLLAVQLMPVVPQIKSYQRRIKPIKFWVGL